MKILLIGNGGREHAVAEAIKRSPQKPELIILANKHNPGIIKLADAYEITENLSDTKSIEACVAKHKPDMAFIGPDNPIADGVADFLEGIGVPTASPKKTVARVESSKSFTRDLMVKYKIPGAPIFKHFVQMEGVEEFLKKLGEGKYVIKADGLMYGKGVKVAGEHLLNFQEALIYCQECLDACGKFVIEEKFIGVEFSLMSFCDGKTLADMPAVQDHKRAFEKDHGPNTGGMGSYSDADHSLPFLIQNDLVQAQEISRRMIEALHKETGEYFKGILYGGFMATTTGVKLIEYNARFGDPEALNVLPILQTDFVAILQAIIKQNLSGMDIIFDRKATVCKYVVPKGYPDNPQKNARLDLSRFPEDAKMYFGSVDERDGNIYTSTSRAIGVVGIAESITDAEQLCERGVQSVHGNVFHRPDIGTDSLIQSKVQFMNQLRGH
jgi:phosphoribosylamine--glycine ligase